jgi:hypothetical protein
MKKSGVQIERPARQGFASRGSKLAGYRHRRRAVRVRRLVEEYSGEKADLQTDIVDVLADLRHLCDVKGWEYHLLDGRGQRHYLAEKWGED